MKRRTIETTIEANGQTYNVKCNECYLELYEEILYRGYIGLEQVYSKYSNNKRYEYRKIFEKNINIKCNLNKNYKKSYISDVKIIGYNKNSFTTGEIIYDNNDIYLIVNTYQNVKVKCITKNKAKERKEKENIVKYYYNYLYEKSVNNKDGIVETYNKYKIDTLMKNYEMIIDILFEQIDNLNEEDREGLVEYIYNKVYEYTVNEETENICEDYKFKFIFSDRIINEIAQYTRNNIEDDVGCIYYY